MDISAEILKKAPVHIQAEVHPSDVPKFAAKYKELTGSKGPSVFSRSRRGVAVAVYFNGPDQMAENLEKMGNAVKKFQSGAYRFCIESEEFFWKMIRNGFRIGSS